MAGKNLNLDLLAIICEFLAVSDILAFALTCSSLRPLATRRLLSVRSIDLKSREMIHMFHSFVFADAPTRTPHIRALNIGSKSPPVAPFCPLLGALEPYDISLLIDIITSCPFLESISDDLQDYSCRRMLDEPGIIGTVAIIDAIAGIQNLRSLSVNGDALNALELLCKVRAPLRMLNTGGIIWDLAKLNKFLPRFAPTLKKLGLYHFMFTEIVEHGVTASNSTSTSATQYSAVRSLFIRSFAGPPLLDHLLHLFPALDDTLSLGMIMEPGDENTYPDLRAANQRTQIDSPPRAWKKLDRVICEPATLFILGLRCPIRLVILNHCDSRIKHFTAEALRENPVPRLKLSLPLRREYHFCLYDSVFSPELARMLTHLAIWLKYTHGGYGTWSCPVPLSLRWNSVLVALRSALQPLHNLTHLRIVIHAGICASPYACPNDYEVPDEFVHQIRGSTFDFDSTAGLLVPPLPSLRFLCLTTGGYLTQRNHGSWKTDELWNVTKAWRIAEHPSDMDAAQDAESVLVPLHEEVAETIIWKEELVVSDMLTGVMSCDTGAAEYGRLLAHQGVDHSANDIIGKGANNPKMARKRRRPHFGVHLEVLLEPL